jgi:hypothetical protein
VIGNYAVGYVVDYTVGCFGLIVVEVAVVLIQLFQLSLKKVFSEYQIDHNHLEIKFEEIISNHTSFSQGH